MQEKMKDIKRELIEKGKKKGVLTFKEISDAFEDIEVTPEEIERLYDVFEKESIELVEDLDKELEEIEVSKEELEDLSVPEGINIDDHVKMYLKEIGKVNLLTPEEELSLAKRMADGEKAKEQPIGVILAGEVLELEDEKAVFVSGAVQMQELSEKDGKLEIGQDGMKHMMEEAAQYFPESHIVGWGIVEEGNPMSRNREVKKIQEREFGQEGSLFLWKNAREQDEIFYAYKFGELMQIGGHYIYYEKNPEMQNYMINTRKENGVTPSEVVEDRAAKNFRSAVREKMEYKEQHQSSAFAYITSAVLVLIVLVIGITTVNNFDKMKAVQNSLETLSETVGGGQADAKTRTETAETAKNNAKEASGTVKKAEGTTTSETSDGQLSDQDFYVVQKGETLAGISQKLYGDTSHVKAICKMNGLSDGNLIYIGQKLLLP